jgi:ribokinase
VDILVVGSHCPGIFIRVKRPPGPGETVIGWDFQEPADGGKGSNQAIAAARLGGKVSFAGCVGQDRIGEEGERWMVEAGVDTAFLKRSATTASGIGFILLDDRGVPAMVSSLGANAELNEADVDRALAGTKGARVLLTQFEIPLRVALYAARAARRQGMLAIVNPAPAPEEHLEGLDCAGILTPNETEAKLLLGLPPGQAAEPPWLAAELRQATGVPAVLVTVGERGVAGCDAEGTWAAAPPPVQAVDTSGAGDVFCAALAVGLVEGRSLREASAWACGVAAFSVTRAGTIPAFPTRPEVETYFHQNV